jgi:hypothetical protein
VRRDFGYCCIRVRDPAGLAAFIGRPNLEWSVDAIDG